MSYNIPFATVLYYQIAKRLENKLSFFSLNIVNFFILFFLKIKMENFWAKPKNFPPSFPKKKLFYNFLKKIKSSVFIKLFSKKRFWEFMVIMLK
jgi:hypothetical protein